MVMGEQDKRANQFQGEILFQLPFLAFAGHPSSDGGTIKIPHGVDVLLQRPTPHPIFSDWGGSN